MSIGVGVLPFLTVRRKSGWLSVIPQDGKVTLVHIIRKPASRPEVCWLDTFDAELGVRDALQRLRTTRKLTTYACTTLMGVGECTVTQLDAPPVPKEERKEALRWSLKEVVSYPIDRACIDVLDIPSVGLPSGRPASVLVVSASEQAVLDRVAPFEEAGVRLDVLDVPEMAQRNIAGLLEDENRGLAFLRIDQNGMMLTLSFHGELVAVRRGEITTLQLNSENEEQRSRARERLVLELQRSLDNFDRQYSHIPISKVVLATSPPVENLAAVLAENTYVPVVDMDLSSVIDFPAAAELKDPQFQSKHLLAIGAALRTGEAS